jgi:histidinol-phosphate aminotransferase
MKEYHPPLGSRDLLRLDFNENTLACSPKVREVLAASSPALSRAIPSASRSKPSSPRILGSARRQVALTNGVDEAIHVLFEAFLEAGDELLLPVPTYTMYEVYASATDARVVTVQAADDSAISLRAPARRHHAEDKNHRHRQSQQPFRLSGHARAASRTRSTRAACRAAGR